MFSKKSGLLHLNEYNSWKANLAEIYKEEGKSMRFSKIKSGKMKFKRNLRSIFRKKMDEDSGDALLYCWIQ